MRKPIFPLLLAVFLVCGIVAPLFGEDAPPPVVAPPQYSLGDQTFALNAGIFIPLFFMSWAPAATPTNLFPGAMGSIQWQPYITPQLRIGGELGGLVASSPNGNLFFLVDLTAKLSYVFMIFPFEIPLSLGVGASLVRYQDTQFVDPLIKPGVSFYWIFNSSLSFGLNMTYWWDMQFPSNPVQARVGNFLECTLSVLYHT